MHTLECYCVDCGAVNEATALVCFACGLSMKTTRRLPAADLAGERLLKRRYRILEQVGKGGFSAVYKAQDTFFNNHLVAVKAVSLSGLSAQEQIEATDAFHREIQVLSGLRFSHLPRIYDHFSDSACWYMVMDFIEGITLEKYLEQSGPHNRLPLGEVFDIALLLCHVLEYLHTRQPAIVFRDLKPANIILTYDGQLYLIDFGIARRFRPGKVKDTLPFGSPGYAAPEQYGRAQTTPRSDIYSLGVLLHQLLTGDDPSQTSFHFAPLPTTGVQFWWNDMAQLIAQMVEMDTNKRPANITVVKEALQRLSQTYIWQQGLPVSGAWAYSMFPSQSVVLPPLVPPPLPPPPAFPATGGGQMLVMQQSVIGGATSTVGGGWSMPQYMPQSAYTPQYPPGGFAIASLILGIISIFILPAMCGFSSYWQWGYNLNLVLPMLYASLSLLPALLSVIFGHIGINRARRTHSFAQWDERAARVGMILGYIFGSIPLLGLICMISNMLISYLH